ncbi:MAG TPA: LysM peptidoglycan-binding domain-containing protein [Arenicellales bacterium]|nr:LysM peptidoglycan-binding domain-containing protein [Arenicellales bacterium]
MPMNFRCFDSVRAAACAAFMLILLNTPASAAGPPVVERHDLECGDTFPCPAEIQRRVDFWIKVFSTWGTDQLVFHDRENPARVYSVITSRHACHRARSARSVEAERSRIEDMLRTLARKATWEEPGWTREELAYLELFPQRDPDEIARAAEKVRCQTGNRDRFREALGRYGRYRSHILKVLREHRLSEDIIYLPFVESAYNPRAYSRAGAAGLWQIMPATARRLGLQLDATLDERFDPRRASWAAAKYLRHSTDVLSEVAREEIGGLVQPSRINPFVITSYNYGVTGMARAIRSVGPDFMQVLNNYRSKSFRTAVRNFYASFLAARYVARNAERYFGPVETDGDMVIAQVALTRPTSVDRIVDVLGVDRDTLEQLNPALTRYVWKGWRLIPEGYALNLPDREGGWESRVARLESLPAEDPQLSGRTYVVQRGDTACQIARVFDVQCRDLIQLNGLGRRALIRVGQTLDIPGKPKPTASQRVASARDGYYTVRRGDTACEIAASFGVECRELIRTNGLGDRAIIHIGQQLRIPGMKGTAPPEDGEYTVQRGDTACGIARSFQVDCRELIRVNGLGRQAVIRPGRKLRIPGLRHDTQIADAEGAGESGSNIPLPEVMADIDVAVRVVDRDGGARYLTTVLPEETLGHYADWLGLGGTTALRELNGMSPSRRLRSGESVELPISSDQERLAFEAARFEFHQTLVDEFKQHYRITGLDDYTITSGDTLWSIASRHDIPYWFLRRVNGNMASPAVGQRIRVPVVAARNDARQPMVEEN